MEAKIEHAVLAKLPQMMPVGSEDVPERISTLENQVATLMNKQTQLETQVSDHAHRHSQQLQVVQAQLTQQGQQLHGHIESQHQTMQAMFESQMQQIRGLLSKRPR